MTPLNTATAWRALAKGGVVALLWALLCALPWWASQAQTPGADRHGAGPGNVGVLTSGQHGLSGVDSSDSVEGQTSSTLLAAGVLYEIVVPAENYEECLLEASFLPLAADAYHALDQGSYLGGPPVAERSYLVDVADSQTSLELSLTSLSADASSRCRQAPLPTLVERGPTGDALAEVALSGELGRTHVVSGLEVEGAFYLRDLSRRQSSRSHPLGNAGRMADRAALETLAYRSVFADEEIIRADLIAASPSTATFSAVEQQAAVEAHVNAGITYDALLALGINGYDSHGGSIFSVVNLPFPLVDIPDPCSGGVFEAGSSFNALASGNVLVYTPPGEYGEFRYLNTYASLLDVIAHEYSHAITDSASDLAYRGESGALNEAFSDWIGVAVQAVATGEVDWRIGEGRRVEVISSGVLGELSEIRNLQNPGSRGQPQRVGGSNWEDPDCDSPQLCNDYCGVHTNSGVANHAFYLMVEGAEETKAIGVSTIPPFAGMGITAAIKLGLYANLNLWTVNETLASAADDLVLAAVQLHGAAAAGVRAVKCAWASVGAGVAGGCRELPPDPGTVLPPDQGGGGGSGGGGNSGGDGSSGNGNSDGDGSSGDGSPGDGDSGNGGSGDGNSGNGGSGDGSPGNGDSGNGGSGDGDSGNGGSGDGSPGNGDSGNGGSGDGDSGNGGSGDGNSGNGGSGDGSPGDGDSDNGGSGDGNSGNGGSGDGSPGNGDSGNGGSGDGDSGNGGSGDGNSGNGGSGDGSPGNGDSGNGGSGDGDSGNGGSGDGNSGNGGSGDGNSGNGGSGDGSPGNGDSDNGGPSGDGSSGGNNSSSDDPDPGDSGNTSSVVGGSMGSEALVLLVLPLLPGAHRRGRCALGPVRVPAAPATAVPPTRPQAGRPPGWSLGRNCGQCRTSCAHSITPYSRVGRRRQESFVAAAMIGGSRVLKFPAWTPGLM